MSKHALVAEPLLSSFKAAAILGISRSTLVRAADRGEIPESRTPGGQRRYTAADVAAFKARMTSAAPVETIDVGPVTVEPAPAPAADFTPDPPQADFHGVAAVERTWPALAGVPAEALLEHEAACDSCWSLDDAASHLAGDKEVA